MLVCIDLIMLAAYFVHELAVHHYLKALSAFSKVELRFPILFEDAAICPLLKECQIIIGQQ
jgi:hypothetical protein